MKLIFDDFVLAIPSIGDVRFQDTAKHPDLAEEASEIVQKHLVFGRTLGDHFERCGPPSDQMDEVLEREFKKLPKDKRENHGELVKAAAKAKNELEEIERDRKSDFDNTLFVLTSGRRTVGVWSISDSHVLAVREGIREIQSQGVLLQAITGPADYQSFADTFYELWVALLRQPSLSVDQGPPVRFVRWYYPNTKRKSAIIRSVQQRFAAGEIDVVSWPTDADEDAIGLVRTKYVTLRPNGVR